VGNNRQGRGCRWKDRFQAPMASELRTPAALYNQFAGIISRFRSLSYTKGKDYMDGFLRGGSKKSGLIR
jgi:hypothetical protein